MVLMQILGGLLGFRGDHMVFWGDHMVFWGGTEGGSVIANRV